MPLPTFSSKSAEVNATVAIVFRSDPVEYDRCNDPVLTGIPPFRRPRRSDTVSYLTTVTESSETTVTLGRCLARPESHFGKCDLHLCTQRRLVGHDVCHRA